MKHLTRISLLVVGALAAGCAPTAEATEPPPEAASPPPTDSAPAETTVTASPDDAFQLAFGQTALVEPGDVRVQFVDLTEDSRCPADVACEWAGQATVTLAVSQGGQAPIDLSLTSTENYSEHASAVLDSHSIWLVEVAPFPQSIEEDIALEDYVVTLIISPLLTAALDEPFDLKVGQAATLGEEPVVVLLRGITEDSRCPSDVVCVQAGQVTARVDLSAGAQAAATLDLTAPGEAEATGITSGGYRVRLVAVTPYPQASNPTPYSDYVVTLVVSRAP